MAEVELTAEEAAALTTAIFNGGHNPGVVVARILADRLAAQAEQIATEIEALVAQVPGPARAVRQQAAAVARAHAEQAGGA